MSDTAAHTTPHAALREKLGGVSCASLVDSVVARHLQSAHVHGLVSPTPGEVLFGRAVTIRFVPTRKDLLHPVENDFAALFYRAIAESGGPGTVLVMSHGGYPDAALGGGRKLSRLRHNGLAGVLADGRLRDFEDLAGDGFVTYCRGESVRQGGGQVMAVAHNVPVEVSGVTVVPGDYVYADRAGAVIIPASIVEDVLADAVGREAKDRASMARMRTEDPATVMARGEER